MVVLPPTAPVGTATIVAPTWNWVTVKIVPASTSLSGVPPVITLPIAVVSSFTVCVLGVAIGASFVPVTVNVKVVLLETNPPASLTV